MKVIVAIDSFKGCLSSAEAGTAAVEGIKDQWPEAEVIYLPVSDGGEGWLDAWAVPLSATEGTNSTIVHDPLLRPVRAKYLKAGELAVIEVAEACGLHLLKPEERNPLLASSRGVGELIVDAMQKGCKQFIVGLGGSGVSDAGKGMMEANPPQSSFIIATDVTNPLYGPNGAAAVFGPQKGATPEMVAELDRRAKAYADENAQTMGFDRSGEAGAGAAGGLGYAFMQFLGAERQSGAELLLEAVHFDDLIRDADYIITGEGSADRQTLMGKLPSVILRHAQSLQVPCHLLAGSIADEDALLSAGFASVHCINPPNTPLSEAMKPEIARQNIKIKVKSLPFA